MSAPAWLELAGWTALHFVWQGTLGALLVAALLAPLRRARTRHRFGLAGLVACTLLPVLTLALGPAALSPPTWLRAPAPAAAAAAPERPALVVVQGPVVFPALQGVTRLVNDHVGLLGALWLCGALWIAARNVRALAALRRLRACASVIARPWRPRLVAEVAGAASRVAVLETGLVDAPVVVGLTRPVVLMPPGLRRMSTRSARAVLAHELAHVHRRDGVASLVQTAVETLWFFHPAVLWLSRRVREEREYSCDDAAAALVGNVACASALARLARLAVRSPRLAEGARGGSLGLRVRRLLGLPAARTGPARRLAAAAAAAALLAPAAIVTQHVRQIALVPDALRLEALAEGLVFVRPGVAVPTGDPEDPGMLRDGVILVAPPQRPFLVDGRPSVPGPLGSDATVTLPGKAGPPLALRLTVVGEEARVDLRSGGRPRALPVWAPVRGVEPAR